MSSKGEAPGISRLFRWSALATPLRRRKERERRRVSDRIESENGRDSPADNRGGFLPDIPGGEEMRKAIYSGVRHTADALWRLVRSIDSRIPENSFQPSW